MKRKSKNKKVCCGMCGIGTYMSSEICVKCATRMLEGPTDATKAAGFLPCPAVEESVLTEVVQEPFWMLWEL